MLPKFYSGCGTRTIRTISISLTFPYIYIAPVIISASESHDGLVPKE